ncbi:MAG: DUF1569 domain-containing protein [Rhodocyclaceae bacterium]|jgi:hypothetical protein|nr:DUF1569 domain-containing protein [Rhodocyclaceae bacterium]MBK6909160.1 DUF1569 domain-containing protein [Rhodocyclaceae bacterium]
MNRRAFLLLSLYVPFAALAAQPGKVQNLDDALRWLDAMNANGTAKMSGAWPLTAVLDHLAQSIEMSMDGYPESKSALFQGTAGAAAFAYFKWRGRMSHDLAAPIPGAAPLAKGDWQAPALRLRAAIKRFEAHSGVLKPHFAYGDLSKADYAIAHTLHIANHQDEISTA